MTRYILFIIQPEGMHFPCTHFLLVVFSNSFHLWYFIFRFTRTLVCFINTPCKNKNLFLFCVCNSISFLSKLLMIVIFSLLNISPYIVSLFYNPSPHFWYLFCSPSNIQVRDFLQVSLSEPWAVSTYLRIGYSKSHVEGHVQGWWMVSFLVGRVAT